MTKNILIIDDNLDDLEFYSDLLNKAKGSYTVYTAQDGEQALEIFKKQDICCTFIDYHLPNMNGVKIFEALQQIAKGMILPVVILTGEPNQTIRAEAARKGALDYIVKDIANTSEQMEAVIQKTVNWAAELNKKQGSIV